MAVESVNSFAELVKKNHGVSRSYLLLYKGGSEQSECARKNVEAVAEKNDEVKIFSADVQEVRDIHGNYNINSVPALIEFEKGEYRNLFKGCHQKDFYQTLLDHIIFEARAAERPQKSVTVYSTPSCPWCTTLKTYLRKNGIRFSDVDVSRDQQAAQDMVRKSGQQGVPQTDINGQMIIGFDQKKLNQLLEIKTN
jgi:glutaredoxin-like YruB-family protein